MTLVADPVENARGRARPDRGVTATGAGGRVVRGGGAGVRARVVGAGCGLVARDAVGCGDATTDARDGGGFVANGALTDRLVVDDPLQPLAAIATRASPAQIRADRRVIRSRMSRHADEDPRVSVRGEPAHERYEVGRRDRHTSGRRAAVGYVEKERATGAGAHGKAVVVDDDGVAVHVSRLVQVLADCGIERAAAGPAPRVPVVERRVHITHPPVGTVRPEVR